MDRELSIFLIAQNIIKDNSKKANLKDKAILFTKMEKAMRDIFKMIYKMESANIFHQIQISSIRDHLLMMLMKATEFLYMRMEIDMKVVGFKIL